MVNVILTTPMWVVNTRLKLQGAKFRNQDLQQTHYRGIFGVLQMNGSEMCVYVLLLHSTNCRLAFALRCIWADHKERGCGNSLEWHSALSHPRPQPSCAVYVLRGHEEEGRERREEGESTVVE